MPCLNKRSFKVTLSRKTRKSWHSVEKSGNQVSGIFVEEFAIVAAIACFVMFLSRFSVADVKYIVKQCPNISYLDMSENCIGPIAESKIRRLFTRPVEIKNEQKIGYEEGEEDYLSDSDSYYTDEDDYESDTN